MATAVDTPPQSKKAAPPALGLLPASLAGAAFLILAVVLVGYVVPQVVSGIVPAVGGFVDIALRIAAQAAAVAGLVWLAFRLLGSNPPEGLRGGVFLTLACAGLTFVLSRAVGLWVEGSGFVGDLFAGAVLAGLIFGSYKLLTGDRGRRWMLSLERQGWFHTFSHKRSQGQRVRKWTMIGILLVGLTGVYALVNQGMLPSGDWPSRIPYLDVKLPLITDVPYSVPILLTALTVWVAWRAVNVPTFADFLIATEAEMNKVSWTPWKKLVRDTVVVLVFTGLMTGFLLAFDLIWGWGLNQVGVIPDKPDLKAKSGANAEW